MGPLEPNQWTTVHSYFGTMPLKNEYIVNPLTRVQWRFKVLGFLPLPKGEFNGSKILTMIPILHCQLQFKPDSPCGVVIYPVTPP